MSIIRKSDYYSKDQKITMKRTKLPTQAKTKYSICPRCSKKHYVRSKGFCKKCGFRFTPDKPYSISKASEL